MYEFVNRIYLCTAGCLSERSQICNARLLQGKPKELRQLRPNCEQQAFPVGLSLVNEGQILSNDFIFW